MPIIHGAQMKMRICPLS